jgi:hypothetical protein
MKTQQMIKTHPDVHGDLSEPLVKCIEECFECKQICISGADACLAEDSVNELKQCIRLNLDCADVCDSTGALDLRRIVPLVPNSLRAGDARRGSRLHPLRPIAAQLRG